MSKEQSGALFGPDEGVGGGVTPFPVTTVPTARRMGLFATRPPARRSQPRTSHEAAVDTPGRCSQRGRILDLYYRHRKARGYTDSEVEEATGIKNGYKRCVDLRMAGFIEPTGETRLPKVWDASDLREQQVCSITAKGIEAWERMQSSER
jgi:hypothetical protein